MERQTRTPMPAHSGQRAHPGQKRGDLQENRGAHRKQGACPTGRGAARQLHFHQGPGALQARRAALAQWRPGAHQGTVVRRSAVQEHCGTLKNGQKRAGTCAPALTGVHCTSACPGRQTLTAVLHSVAAPLHKCPKGARKGNCCPAVSGLRPALQQNLQQRLPQGVLFAGQFLWQPWARQSMHCPCQGQRAALVYPWWRCPAIVWKGARPRALRVQQRRVRSMCCRAACCAAGVSAATQSPGTHRR